MIRGVIFDVDGTLIDSNFAHIEAWRRVFERFGHKVPPDRIFPQIGKGGDQLIPALLGDRVSEGESRAMREAYSEVYVDIARHAHLRTFPGAEQLLDTIRKRGIKVALATSSKIDYLRATEHSAGVDLEAHADEVVTASDTERSKPAPDLVHAALDKLGLAADECVFVGDTPYDAEAAKKAGVDCLGVLCGGRSAGDLLAAGARSVWRDPADLLEHLDEALADVAIARE